MKRWNNKGFTLIEVLAVIVIIAVLGLIAIPNIISTLTKGKESSYRIMINNIKTASQSLFEELEYAESTTHHYEISYENDKLTIKPSDGVVAIDESDLNEKVIRVNLQTLVSNGFLSGTSGQDSENVKSKIITNPKTGKNIGSCIITITKKKTGSNKVNYVVTNYEPDGSENTNSNTDCPTTEDYQ